MECALCGSPCSLLYEGHPGYQKESQYDIYDCLKCQTRFAQPLRVDSSLYDAIYSQAEVMPGYARYLQYAKQVLREADPLAYLARSEDTYWAISRFLRSASVAPPCQLLEVGSGLGYLSYSLKSAGFGIRGLDISGKAVREAEQRYGKIFVCDDFISYARQHQGEYQAVIMTELIEHVPNVREFVSAAKTVLAPGGSLILTTPNRSYYPDQVLWDTDPPPIHLWWFSETSMRHLAEAAGFSVEFTDFSDFHRFKYYEYREPPVSPFLRPTRTPMLDDGGRILSALVSQRGPAWKHYAKEWLPSPVATWLRSCFRTPDVIGGYFRFNFLDNPEARGRRGTMAAILKKPV